jgi:RND family efflux transporter MFP subunit
LSCDYNTQVKRGQSCAKIDPRPYQSMVDQGKANLAVAKAQLEKDKASLVYAKLTLERHATLVQTNAVSRDAYDNAKSVYDQALAQITFDEATIQQRQAVLDAAQVNLDYTNIISPVDGTVVSRNVTMGQTVAASFQTPTLFLIATDLTKMQVDANVSEVESRRGAVAWAMRQRSVSSPRSSNRTCRFPASGFPTGFIAEHTAAGQGARVVAAARREARRPDGPQSFEYRVLAPCTACAGSDARDH